MKEHAKLYKPHRQRAIQQLGKRLSDGDSLMMQEEAKEGDSLKRKKLAEGRTQFNPPQMMASSNNSA
jgi:hypothetical protein